jgi:hypothetical protein
VHRGAPGRAGEAIDRPWPGAAGRSLAEPKRRGGRWTQRFQAAVFEYHPENDRQGLTASGLPIRGYAVQLALLGDMYIAKYNLGLR